MTLHELNPVATSSAAVLPGFESPSCFVIMPFVETGMGRTTGFFDEVYNELIAPAVAAAGFRPISARRPGSDFIQATIFQSVIDAPLVVADVTDNNPNVMMEVGMRLGARLPICIIKDDKTVPVSNINILRYATYQSALWRSTIRDDLPRITEHVKATWENRTAAHPSE